MREAFYKREWERASAKLQEAERQLEDNREYIASLPYPSDVEIADQDRQVLADALAGVLSAPNHHKARQIANDALHRVGVRD